MSSRVCFLYVLMLSIVISITAQGAVPEDTAAPPAKAENFRLVDQTGFSRELYHLADSKGVILFAFDAACPVSVQTAAALQEHADAAKEAGITVWGLNIAPEASREAVAAAAAEAGLTLPILMDRTQRIAHSLGLTRAGETLLLDPAQSWSIVYRGAADNRFIAETPAAEATEPYVRLAAESLAAGQPIALASTRAAGKPIDYADASVISYANDIAPILAEKCVNCHHDGGLGPFTMDSHKKANGWAPMMRETIRTGRMPPWHADASTGPYQHDRSLSVDEERTLLAWIEAGAPNDSDTDPLAEAAAARSARPKWQLGEPDHVVRLPEVQQIDADGLIPYRYIPVPSGLKENRWLKGIEVRTDNPAVVHHALIFVGYPRDYRHMQPKASSGLDGYFASYLPGAQLDFFREGSAMFLPHDTVFLFQMHYSTTGKPETDMTELGLHFADGPPENAIHMSAAHYEDFIIPPHAYDQPTKAKYEFKRDARILGLSPHMHFRGSRFKFAAVFPGDEDGAEKPLLNVPFYEFDWQPMYFFEKPIDVPEGTIMKCDGAFNNSRFNPKNPDPSAVVAFGEQSHQEMFIGYVMYETAYDPEEFKPQEIDPSAAIGIGEMITKETLPGMAFKFGPIARIDFHADGLATAGGGVVKGTWTMEGNDLQLVSPLGTYDVFVHGDEMIFRDEVLVRLQ